MKEKIQEGRKGDAGGSEGGSEVGGGEDRDKEGREEWGEGE